MIVHNVVTSVKSKSDPYTDFIEILWLCKQTGVDYDTVLKILKGGRAAIQSARSRLEIDRLKRQEGTL